MPRIHWAYALPVTIFLACSGNEFPIDVNGTAQGGPEGWTPPILQAPDVDTSVRPPPSTPYVPEWPELPTEIPHFELGFTAQYEAQVLDAANNEYVPGTFEADGKSRDVELRQRGQGARFHPKHSWKVRFPSGEYFDGARRLNFLAEWLDAGYLSDMFSYRMLRAAGVTAPTSRYVTLDVNGTHEGVFVQLENVDKFFLRAHGFDDDSNIYRCGERDCEMKITPRAHYQQDWEKKTNEDQPRDDLDLFLYRISRTPEHEFKAFLEKHLSLDQYLRYMAANAVLSNYGIDDSGSFFIHDRTTGKWTLIPWDLNNSRMVFYRQDVLDADPLVRRVIPVYTAYDTETIRTWEWKNGKYGGAHRPFSVLNQRIWDIPELRHRVLDHLEELLGTVFSEESAFEQIDAQYEQLEPLYSRDPWVSQDHARRSPDFLKLYVTRRRDFIQDHLEKERTRGEGGVVINAIGAAGGDARDEHGEADAFIELYNRESSAVDLSDQVITDELRNEFKYRLPAGTVVPARGKLVLWADGQPEQGANHLPFTITEAGGEVGLFTGRGMAQIHDLLFYSPLEKGAVYARKGDGAEVWHWRD